MILRLKPVEHLEPERLEQEKVKHQQEDTSTAAMVAGNSTSHIDPHFKSAEDQRIHDSSSSSTPVLIQAVKRTPMLKLVQQHWHMVFLLVSAAKGLHSVVQLHVLSGRGNGYVWAMSTCFAPQTSVHPSIPSLPPSLQPLQSSRRSSLTSGPPRPSSPTTHGGQRTSVPSASHSSMLRA